jgi:hypothetical protein
MPNPRAGAVKLLAAASTRIVANTVVFAVWQVDGAKKQKLGVQSTRPPFGSFTSGRDRSGCC